MVHMMAASHATSSPTMALQLNLDAGARTVERRVQDQLVAGLDRALEARAVDADEVEHLVVARETPSVSKDSSAQAWAMASSISTPGMTGRPGKWPVKNGSLTLTFLMARIVLPAGRCRAPGRPAETGSGGAVA
jgi:hypothetical protein